MPCSSGNYSDSYNSSEFLSDLERVISDAKSWRRRTPESNNLKEKIEKLIDSVNDANKRVILANQSAKAFEAVLCATFNAIIKSGEFSNIEQMLEFFDEKECGVPISTVLTWWNQHQEIDRLREEAEARLSTL